MKASFHISYRWKRIQNGTSTKNLVTTSFARAVSHTILGAIYVMVVVNIEIRVPNSKPKRIRVDGVHKRKQPQTKKLASKSTVTGHYMTSCRKQWTVWIIFLRWRDFTLLWAMHQFIRLMKLKKWFRREDTEASIFLHIHLSLTRSRIFGPQWRAMSREWSLTVLMI